MTGVLGSLDDATLLRAHVDGDPDAFTELVRRHRDRLWAVALRTLGDREEAADAVQDALISAYRSADRFRGDAAVTTWLHRIVVNACLDRTRRRQARPTVPMPDADAGAAALRIAQAAYDSDTTLTVRAALAQLPPDQRITLVLMDMQGYSVAEIAAILGIAEGTVKSRCARGRARLAVLLGHLRLGEQQTSVGHAYTRRAGHSKPSHRNLDTVRDVGSEDGAGPADGAGPEDGGGPEDGAGPDDGRDAGPMSAGRGGVA